jgi:hypothetical protein
MKYHLVAYKGIKSDGKTLVLKDKQYSSLTSSCGSSGHRTRATMGSLTAVDFLARIKADKLSGWDDETICKKCKARLVSLIDEGKKIRGKTC